MADLKNLFSHAASILTVADVPATAEYYRDKLGFEISFLWNDPPDYAVLKAGEGVSIHLSKSSNKNKTLSVHTAVYIFVHDVDALYKAYQERGINIHTPIGDQEYGMRDFDIKDPNGYILTFGKGN